MEPQGGCRTLVDVEPSDQELWRLAVAGDSRGFGDVFERHLDRVFMHCVRRLGSHADGQDAASQVFMTAWLKADRVRFVDGSVLPWLLLTATHASRNLHRRERRESAKRAKLLPPPAADVEDEAISEVQAEIRRRHLAHSIAHLSRKARQVVELCDLGELSQAEAAAVLNIPIGTVKSRLARAHDQLRSLMTDKDPGIGRAGAPPSTIPHDLTSEVGRG
jgi:RNA polymerase sigma-70 factor (ECF subfamily)